MKINATNTLIVDPRAVPPEGLALAGAVAHDVFELAADDWARPRPPLEYAISVHRSGDLLLIEGSVASRFQLQCARCLEWFDDLIRLEPYQAEVEIEDETANVDLTVRIREDILLALPGFPRCEDSVLEPRDCPAGEILRQLGEQAVPPGERDDDVWGALDQINIDKPSPQPES